MKQRYEVNPEAVKRMNTDELRENFLVEEIFKADETIAEYTHYDRMILGGIMPVSKTLALPEGSSIAAEFFLQRREIGLINVGGAGVVVVDGKEYTIESKDGIYIGKGVKEVTFASKDAKNPAKFYFNSAPSHIEYPTVQIFFKDAQPVHLGDNVTSNKRTIYQYVHPAVCQSAQLLMGMTVLEEGNMWNTMPCHTHDRRMETYLYFDINEGSRVFHFMGEVNETRHLVIKESQAIVSPPWSIHSGVGTGAYTFIWAMAGENQDFKDMDMVPMEDLR